MSQFKYLEKPMTIRGKVYRNRLIAAPTLFAHSVFFIPEIAENVYRMVENRAKGGFAAVSTGELPVNNQEGTTLFMERDIDMEDYSGEDFKKVKAYADRIKKYGALAYLEFSHEGAVAETKAPYEPWGPDEYVRKDGVKVNALNEEMMAKICADYTKISKFARACGFDGVLLHGGHGFNIQQFVSPMTNHRTDEYGGSMVNRARFPKKIIKAVREGVGEDMIIEFRMSAEDGIEGGMTIDHMVAFCKEIDGLVDIIHVSNGLKWAGNMTQTFSDFFDEHGVNVEHAAKVKAAVKHSKVAVIGGINDPAFADKIIEAGKVDFVALGRQGFADPEFPNKAFSGQEDSIRKCVRCFSCYPGFCEHKTDVPLWEKGLSPEAVKKIYSPASMGRCAINPNSGFRWYEDQQPTPESKKKILVVGAGIAGLQASLTATQRGHDVVLIEKTDQLGGIINFTDFDEDKIDLRNFKNLLVQEVKASAVDIRMNEPCSKEIITEVEPDQIIVGIGAYPVKPNIKGIDKAFNALDTYKNMDKIGKKVVIAGGGLVGCEVGLHLANHGHEVTVVDMQHMMAFETFGYYRNALLDEMDKRCVKQILNAKVLSFEEDGLVIKCEDKVKKITADTCVYSLGMMPNKEAVILVKAMTGDIETHFIGDCEEVGKVGDAVHAGYEVAISVI
ncbi:FAD-dependent oxidoreductase [Fusibacter sp. 3D3]|uniref:oxidoreductase n=1 Tax=Fusibacter sp. 3D3 TaxID=1048380 RepID=UPI0008536118|nr:FAD-dependent oxidoreductase [Fusibacter sp. 3D3]GAU76504.1 2,4-dienoyl-CoA reductase [NADPH] [Fusibacter sp. 3D3]